ncbi:hypothetical protein BDR03DRAFT_958957 [Suillus americanus]|nr:hypothetical protein BDR03DRAFT_958957 [Suillus americanus]
MNIFTIILLTFTAGGPLCARAMPSPQDTDPPCVWLTCGAKNACAQKYVTDSRPCNRNGRVLYQLCCTRTTCASAEMKMNATVEG